MTTPVAENKAGAAPAEAVKTAFDFLDLKAQFASIREEVMAAIAKVMESQQFVLGPEVASFEREVASLLGAKHAVGCASGTDALMLALMAEGIGAEDEVITTPFSFVATAGAIVQIGAKPVFVDIDPLSFNIDAGKIEAAITPKTRAILPVHLFGLPAEIERIVALGKAKDLIVIEDAAQAIGARVGAKFVGTFGSFGCFSFFPSKNLGAAGDGGLITTNDDAMAERLRMIRVHGSSKKYFHEIQGVNSRLDALQAAVLRVKLRHLPEWESGRRNRASRYARLFEERGLGEFLAWPAAPSPLSHHAYNQFTIRARRRDELKESLRRSGIPSEIYYPLCLHLQQAFVHLGYQAGEFLAAETASQEVLSLPVYPELTEVQQDKVVEGIASFYASGS
jgi:dTDP-4-amino-4,6-dideoxygalactose transaminase